MSEKEPSSEEVVQAVYGFAAEQLKANHSPAEVEAKLVEKGLDQETAAAVVKNLCEARGKVLKEAGRKNMIYGALWCVGGLLVTAFTYGSASSSGGGRYLVAWGAIIFGAIQFFRGLSQSSSG